MLCLGMTAQAAPQEPPKNNRPRVLRRVLVGIGGLVLIAGLSLIPARPLPGALPEHPAATAADPGAAMDAYLLARLDASRKEGIRPGNEERLERPAAGRAKVAILYVHGFGASRAEGEAVVDQLASGLGATVYYTRLPGHGGGLEAHAAAKPEEYFARVEEDFHRVRPLGERLVLIGSSTGGLLCTWLAARHPEEVSALVLASPLYDFAPAGSFLISRRVGMRIIEAVFGEYRDASWKRDPERRKQPGYEDHWITKQRSRALLTLDGLRRTIVTDAVLAAVRAPVLMLYHYADDVNQDTVVSVSAIHEAFARMNGGHPHALSREVAIADGNHILLSAYVRTDKERILSETRAFLGSALTSH